MSRTINIHPNFSQSDKAVDIQNTPYVFSIKINKTKVLKALIALTTISAIIGYIALTVMSYSFSTLYFWTLIKAGVLLSLIGFVAYNQK